MQATGSDTTGRQEFARIRLGAGLVLLLQACSSFAAVSDQFGRSESVASWQQPGLAISVSDSRAEIRGHVNSRQDGVNRIDAFGSDRPVESDLRLHVLLPDYWRGASAALDAIMLKLNAGEAFLSRDRVDIRGLVRAETKLSHELLTLADSLPESVEISVNLTTWTQSSLKESCRKLQSDIQHEPMLFDRNATQFRRGYQLYLNRVADVLRRCSGVGVRVLGHSDGLGTAEGNLAVSQKRANVVADYLSSVGAPDKQIDVVALGSTKPLASNASWAGRNKNRRVELEFYSVLSDSSDGP